MSIAIGLISRAGAVIAADSQRIEANGSSVTLDCDKTFAISDWLIGGAIGLLEYSGKTVADHLTTAVGPTRQSAASCLNRVSEHLGATLAAIDTGEVAFHHRCVDCLMVVRPGRGQSPEVFSLETRPSSDGATFNQKRKSFASWSIVGDDLAKAAVEVKLKLAERHLGGYRVLDLEKFARHLIDIAIAAAGPHPHYSQHKACGGGTRLHSLRFLR